MPCAHGATRPTFGQSAGNEPVSGTVCAPFPAIPAWWWSVIHRSCSGCPQAGEAHNDELHIAAVARSGRQGAVVLRSALRLADHRAESPWESLLRVMHVVCAVPVEPQYVVLDEDGAFVARGDLWIKGTRVLHEYDGGHHRERASHREDLRRDRALGNAMWQRHGYTDVEVLHQAVGIFRDADRCLGRPHRPERIRAWHALLRRSLFTPTGTAGARQRWRMSSGSRA